MMKRVILAFIVLCMALSMFAGCSSSDTKKSGNVSNTEATSETTSGATSEPAAETIPAPAGDTADHGGYRPNYQGYGTDTPGGRGGTVLRVTNLNDSGPGSLRGALEAEGPRIIIFETSGTIALKSAIHITHPYVTIAGQTAPSPGVNVRNHGIYIDTNDVVVQHLRMRMGDTDVTYGNECDFFVGGGAHHIVFDHVSVAWSVYLGISAADYALTGKGHPTKIALLDSIIAYPLAMNIEYTGLGVLMGHQNSTADKNQYTQARNMYVHNSHRQPLMQAGRHQLVNNIIYGSGPWKEDNAYDRSWSMSMFWMNWISTNPDLNKNPSSAVEAAIINGVYIPSIGTGSGDTAGSTKEMKPFSFNMHPDNIKYQKNKIWLYGNQGPYINGPEPEQQRSGVYWLPDEGGKDFSNEDIWYTSEPAWHSEMSFWTIPTDNVPDYLFANAGARPLDRDPVDIAAVSQTKAGLIQDTPNMGSRIRTQEEMGGHPVLAVNTRALKIPENPNDVAPGQTFRTNIEMWLEDFARALEPSNGGKVTEAMNAGILSATPVPADIIKEANATLTVTPETVIRENTFKVSFGGMTNPTATDWIGLYGEGADNNSPLDWRYTSGSKIPGDKALTEGSMEFSIAIPGVYEFRLFKNYSYESIQTAKVTVTPKYKVNGPATLTVSSYSVSPGDTVTVTHSNIPDSNGRKWIGLYKTGDRDQAYGSWCWVDNVAEGSYEFVMPTEPGTYDFRIFDGGYDKIVGSEKVTVK